MIRYIDLSFGDSLIVLAKHNGELTRKFAWIMGRLRTDYPGKFVELSVGLRRAAAQPLTDKPICLDILPFHVLFGQIYFALLSFVTFELTLNNQISG